MRDGGGESLAELVKTYGPSLGSLPDFHDAPELELDYNQVDLGEDDSDREEARCSPTDTREPEWAEPTVADETGASREQGEPLPWQPGLKKLERKIEIREVGVFRRHNRQPTQLRTYPYVRAKPVPFAKRQSQAYQGQDHYNPSWTHVRSTQRERFQALVEVQRGSGTPNTDYHSTPTFELQLYARENRILQEAQPWAGNAGPEADYNRLEECDHLTMDAIRRSG